MNRFTNQCLNCGAELCGHPEGLECDGCGEIYRVFGKCQCGTLVDQTDPDNYLGGEACCPECLKEERQ